MSRTKYNTTSDSDLQRIINSYLNGDDILITAGIWNINLRTAMHIIRTYRVNGSISRKPCGGNKKSLLTAEITSFIRK